MVRGELTGMAIFNSRPNLVELLTPKINSPDFESDLETFAARFAKILAHDAVVSIPDNPLGLLHFAAPEVLTHLALPVDPERCLVHLNTFHAKSDLDSLLDQARKLNIRCLLCVSGDGSQRLSRLNPSDLGLSVETVTSVELLAHIGAAHGGYFTCGAAFNQYEPAGPELEKMRRKIAAGAKFIITQPVVGRDESVMGLARFGVPVFAGAWMSRRIDLLKQCLGVEEAGIPADYDPLLNLQALRETYRGYGIYYSLLGFKREWDTIMHAQNKSGGQFLSFFIL